MDPSPSPSPRFAEAPVADRDGRGTVAVTASVDGIDTEVAVPLGARSDPASALDALTSAVGRTDLVVDRTGLAVRGAVVGRDLLVGDRLVPADERRRPAVTGTAGPLRGITVTVDRDLALGRGGRFGPVTVDDPEVSRTHLHLAPTPGALRATEAGSTNGTGRNGRSLVGTVDLSSGDRLTVGSSTLVVLGDPPRGPHLAPADHTVALRAAVDPPVPAGQVTPPDGTGGERTGTVTGDRPAMGRWPWLAVGVAGPTAAIASGSAWAVAVTAGALVVTVAITIAIARRSGRRPGTRPGAEANGSDRPRHGSDLARRADHLVRAAHRSWPDPHHLVAAVAGWSPELWSTRPGADPVVVRVGAAPRRTPGGEGGGPDRPADHTDPGRRREAEVPLLVELRRGTTVDVVAPAVDLLVEHLAAWLLQLAARHGPDDLELMVLGGPGSPLDGLARSATWLPHVRAGGPGTPPTAAELAVLLERRTGAEGHRHLVVLGEASALSGADGGRTITELAHRCGATVLRASVDALPATVPTGSGPGDVDRVAVSATSPPTVDHDGATGVADLLSPALAEDLARLLAPLAVDRGPAPATAATGHPPHPDRVLDLRHPSDDASRARP